MPSLSAFRIFCLALLFLAAHPVAASEASPAPDLQKALKQEGLSGIVWSVVDGENVTPGALGLSNLPKAEAMRPDSRVHVGSIAKSVVALGVLRLVSEGRISLDDPVERVLPALRFDNQWQQTRPVTIRHLLDHTSGLEDARLWHILSAEVGPDYPLAGLLKRDPSVFRVRTKPGAVMSYSNLGYGLLAMVIERVTKTRYEQWLGSNILQPLGMKDSTMFFTTQPRHPALAWGHQDDGSSVAALPMASRAAGQLTTTAADMAQLARFLMSDGSVAGTQIVRQDLLAAMARPQHAAAAAGLTNGYALGLGHFDRAGQVGRCHGGDIIGFRAMLCVYPQDKKAYFRAINMDKEDANYRQFDEILIGHLGVPARAVPPPIALTSTAGTWTGQYVPLVSRITVTRYAELLTEGFQFRLARGGAEISADDGKIVRLYGAGGALLRAEEKVAPSHILYQDAAGEKRISTDMRTFRKAHWLERPGLWIGLGAGALGLGYLLLVSPIIAWRTKRRIVAPLHLVVVTAMVAGGLLYAQPLQRLGDLTIGSALLATATAALPIALIWQGLAAFKSRRRLEMLACAAALQWVGTLAVFGLVPLFLWG